MKINSTIQDNNRPAFKSAGWALNTSGHVMQSIENGGFLASFLIQDGIGMTLPRTYAGFLRDKEKTGHYNKQEGFEVLGREGMTGPCMMAVAPLSLMIAAKFGRSTSVNSQLIKRFGANLKEFVSASKFNKELLNQPEKFKQEFYKTNIKQMLENTVGKENAKESSVEYILQQINNAEKIPDGTKLKKFRGKAKYKSECMSNIIEHINNIKYSTATDLDMLQKVKFGNDSKVFSTKDTIDAMIKYTDDAITANKHLNKLDALQAESIKNKALGKRLITNISMIAATLGVLSALPKIYARSNTAPGARKKEAEYEEGNNNIAFKGKKDPIEKLGKAISKNKSDFVSSELEYNGHNFTNTLMAGLSIFGLLAPRGLRAYSRAQVDEDGKKDLTELYEILMRDITSSLAVVFAVPMGTRALVTAYEKRSGFVLMHKDRSKNNAKTILDLLNPYSKAHVLTNSEITALYDKVDTKAKMLNFCKYIDKNGGDIHKIIDKSSEASKIFNSSTFELSTLKGMPKADKNKKLIEFFEGLKGETADKTVKLLMKGADSAKRNKIASFARGLNSVPGLLTTFLISPYLLGWFIPRLAYKNTNRIHENQDREKAAKAQQKLSTNV